MRRRHRHAWAASVLVAAWLFASACAAPESRRAPAAAGSKTVYLVHNRWHAAIVTAVADIPAAAVPEIRDFGREIFVEVSWGDADYFPDPDSGLWLAMKAALWSSGSVLHLVGFGGSVASTYPGAEVLEIRLSEAEYRRLIDFISREFQRPGKGQPAVSRPGLFSGSRFYPANSRFSLLRTCNTWVAEALAAAGLPVEPRYVITANSLASQLKRVDKDAPGAVPSQKQFDKRPDS